MRLRLGRVARGGGERPTKSVGFFFFFKKLVRAARARYVLAMGKKKLVIRINFRFYFYHKIKI